MRTLYKTSLFSLSLLLVAGMLTVAFAGDQMGMQNSQMGMNNNQMNMRGGQMGMNQNQMGMNGNQMMMKPGTMVWYHGKQMQFGQMMSAKSGAEQDTLVMVPGSGYIAGSAPGAKNWHGGNWMMYQATWKDHKRMLRTMHDVMAAMHSGDLTLQRMPSQDFACPIVKNDAKTQRVKMPMNNNSSNGY